MLTDAKEGKLISHYCFPLTLVVTYLIVFSVP